MFFLSDMLNRKLHLPKPGEALPGRGRPIRTAARHFVSKRPLKGPYPDGMEIALFAMGNFWSAEPLFWNMPGVWVTAAGYAGGSTPNPTYQEVCTGQTGHAETVRVVFDPAIVSYAGLLQRFWESHDPTQGMRQGSDIGTVYRSAIFAAGEARQAQALAARDAYQAALGEAGLGRIGTEIRAAPEFYFAEAQHQQYMARNPGTGHELQGTGVLFPASGQAPATPPGR
ncbi:MAG: peptide-methionine (S)-S-oxide reductase MsrA [Hyphomicrobiales bacterium]|nr:peptide-methionine (S)-S-oxide reductase MsrA [Hyphomicrobiales bacterium]